MNLSKFLNGLRHIKHGTRRVLINARDRTYEKRVTRAVEGRVITGVFAGTKLLSQSVFGSEIPKLLGTYELELQETLKKFLGYQPKTICNIGGAEGYYAIGCARHKDVREVLTYEALVNGQNIIADNSMLNEVDHKVTVLGMCDEAELWCLLNEKHIDLLLIDIEGAELDILSARNVGKLSKTLLLIESHDFYRPNCMFKLESKFKHSHTIKFIKSRNRTLADFPLALSLPDQQKLRLMNERRPGIMTWLACEPM